MGPGLEGQKRIKLKFLFSRSRSKVQGKTKSMHLILGLPKNLLWIFEQRSDLLIQQSTN